MSEHKLQKVYHHKRLPRSADIVSYEITCFLHLPGLFTIKVTSSAVLWESDTQKFLVDMVGDFGRKALYNS